MSLPGFDAFEFRHDGKTRDVYRRGRGPGVVVMHEVPGSTPPVAAFATRVADAGFTVVAPQLFGTPGRPETLGYVLSSMIHCCVSREFSVLAANESSPGNPHGIPQTAHSVVTRDLVDEAGHPTRAALERVLGFFKERLLHA